MLLPIDKNWTLETDLDSPHATKISRRDGRFFSVVLDDSQGYIQPVIVETADAEGICGVVAPIVRLFGAEWQVAVSTKQRIGSTQTVSMIEANRFSIDNPQIGSLDKTSCGQLFELGSGRTNSARIVGTVRCGVLIANEDFVLPDCSQWLSLLEFADTLDMPAQAVLFRFVMRYVLPNSSASARILFV